MHSIPMPPDKKEPARPSVERAALPLIVKIRQCIDQYGMLSNGDRVLAGVSGGPDSVALIHVLCELDKPLGIELGIAHFDHGLRPESAAREAEWVKQLAVSLGVAFYPGRLSKACNRGSLEAWLRQQRYGFLERTAKREGFSKIAVGHQANDNAEAVLMHLLRGSGIRGISGIPPVRGNRIVRPLIRVYRSEIIDYLKGLGIAWLNDPSNENVKFERNRIRHRLIPMLERDYKANLVQILNRTASLCFEEDRWIDKQLSPTLNAAILSIDAERMELATELLAKMERPVQRRILRSALKKWQGHLQRLTAAHIEQIIALLTMGNVARECHMPGRIRVERTTNSLIFSRRMGKAHGRVPMVPSPGESDYCYILKTAKDLPKRLSIREAGLRLTFTAVSDGTAEKVRSDNRNQAYFDLARLEFPLVVRNPEPGDRIAPFGMQGTQKLKKLYIDRKIPKAVRWQTPVLASGETILWAVGVRRGRQAAIGGRTEQMIHIVAEPLRRLNESMS